MADDEIPIATEPKPSAYVPAPMAYAKSPVALAEGTTRPNESWPKLPRAKLLEPEAKAFVPMA